MNRRLGGTVALLLGCVAVGLVYLKARGGGAPRAELLRCRFEPGEELAYTLRSEVRVGDKPAPDLVRKSALYLRVLRAEPAGGALLAAIFDIQNRAEYPPRPDSVELRADNVPYLFQIDSDCKIGGFAFLPSTAADTRLHLQDALQSLEVLLARGPSDGGWVRMHRDVLGTYNAFYAPREPSMEGHPVFSRRRGPYVGGKIHGLGGTLSFEVEDDQAEFTLDRAGRWLRQYSGRSRRGLVATQVSGTTRQALISRTELVRDDSLLPFPVAGDLLRPDLFTAGAVDRAEVAQTPGKDLTTRMDPEVRAKAEKSALPDLISRLSALFASGKSTGLDEARHVLIAFLQLHPEAAEQVYSQLRSGQLPGKTASVLAFALARSGTPQAVQALERAVWDDGMPTAHRAQATSALVDQPTPTEKTLRTLTEATRQPSRVSEDVSGVARNAIGQLAAEQERTQPQLAEEARKVLREELQRASDPGQKAYALTAIGNAGHPSLIEDIRPVLTDPQDELRATAAGALRRMPLDLSEPLLRQRLGVDHSPQVRQAAATALLSATGEAGKPPDADSLSVAANRLGQESEKELRAVLIQLLGRAAATTPMAKQALIAQFHREQEPELLALIGRFCSAAELK